MNSYLKLARAASKIWIKHGALDYNESVAEDLEAHGCLSFKKLAGAKTQETVVFAWITYKSKAHRNKVNKQVMSDPDLKKICVGQDMPFDSRRMATGGFEIKVKEKGL